MNLALTFDDVCLVPQFNNVSSRLSPALTSWLTKNTEIGIPILAANMDTVIGDNLADVLVKRGTIPIFHRFTTKDQMLGWVLKYPNCFISIGVSAEDMVKFDKILQHVRPSGVVVDIAHGHDKRVLDFIDLFKHRYDAGIDLIAGNVCTPQAYQDLVNAGVDAVKVGVGPGAACTTRMVTGFGVPQFSAVYEIGQLAKKLRVPIIADGGIRGSRDVALALAAGASSVMIGKLFAQTEEAAGQGHYRGQASRHFQTEYYGGVKEGTVPEGSNAQLQVNKSADELIDEILGGLRSAMTYGGAKDIKEFQRKAEFRQVTSTYMTESGTRL